jgi:S-adenosylmethionine synthetase
MIRQLLYDTGFQGCEQYVPDADTIKIRLPYIEAMEDICRGICGEPGPEASVGVYGYATDKTPELMPLPTLLAHRLAARADAARRSGALPWLLPFGWTKVSIRYARGVPVAIDSVELQLQHLPEIDHLRLLETAWENILFPGLPEAMITNETRVHVNPQGACIVDGLLLRAGVSGRAVGAETYGAHCPLPSTGLSGQGTANLERWGTLMAWHLAKHVVAAGLARRCSAGRSRRSPGSASTN